jgi:hypothetical protein
MKRLVISFLLAAVWPLAMFSQPAGSFINNGVINAPPDTPPQVDALNFVNNGTMNIQLGSGFSSIGGLIVETLTTPPFDFSDVLNYTNNGTMTCDAGFRFDTAPSTSGVRHMASSFFNKNRGLISSGSISNFVVFGGLVIAIGSQGLPLLEISASNVVNAGVLDAGQNGLLSVAGNNVNLANGVLNMEGPVSAGLFSVGGFCASGAIIGPGLGIFPDYWGIGRGTNNGLFDPPPTTPLHNVTFANTGGGSLFPTPFAFSVPNAQGAELSFFLPGTNGLPDFSNQVTQIVFAGNFDNSVSTTIRFQIDCGGDFTVPVIQWAAPTTAPYTQAPLTNTLYLADFFGGSTNFKTFTNFSLTGTPIIPTQTPVNYQYSRTFPDYLNNAVTIPGGTVSLADFDIGIGFTNSYSAYGVQIAPVTAVPDPNVLDSTVSNSPGRIEITANQVLNLSHTTLEGPNYVSLTATNHFAGSAGAQFTVPTSEINLASTNGHIAISNLVAQYVPLMAGTVDAWSGQWTNIVNGATNRFHMLMVASALSPTSPTAVLDFMVRSTNSAAPGSPGDVYISDLLNIEGNFLINGKSLTVTSNGPGSSTPVGQINILSTANLGTADLPNLQNVTNWGVISSQNGAYFEISQGGGDGNSPTPVGPYSSVVNHGTISTGANVFWANYFENTGLGTVLTNGFLTSTQQAVVFSAGGNISVQSPTSVLRNGLLDASGGDIDLLTGNLTFSNTTLIALGALNLAVTNNLNPTTNGSGRLWTNFITVSDGFNLPLLPSNGGDLLGTTVTSIAPGYTSVNTWDGQDLGCSPTGFSNNMSLGHVIFDATTNSFGPTGAFEFTPANGNNAIYIDLISLADAATNHANNNYPQFIIDPGMKVYFGGALIGNADISEKLNGANGGAFCWVSNWNNGPFSSTNLLYPSGTNYSFNRALVASCDIDSNGNGIPNCQDPTPIPTPDTIAVRVRLTNAPSLKALVSWDAPAFSTNYLYTRTNLTSTSWLLVTNFIQGPIMTPVTITNQARTTGGSLYRVGISFRN